MNKLTPAQKANLRVKALYINDQYISGFITKEKAIKEFARAIEAEQNKNNLIYCGNVAMVDMPATFSWRR